MNNRMILKISAIGQNEGFARSAVAAFAASLGPTIDEFSDVKTAVSEAVTNCVVHAYKGAESTENYITITCEANEETGVLHIEVADTGCGIENVEKALQPFFTTSKSAERSGMGFTIMQTFTDGCEVTSEQGGGTVVKMRKKFGKKAGDNAE